MADLDDLTTNLIGLKQEVAESSATLTTFETPASQGFMDSKCVKALRRILREFRAGDALFVAFFHREEENADGQEVTVGITYNDFGPAEAIALLAMLQQGLKDQGRMGGTLEDLGGDE